MKQCFVFAFGLILMACASSPDIPTDFPPGPEIVENPENLPTEKFEGILESVNTGCFADGECYVTVDNKHVTVIMGWSQETVGSVQGVDGFGDLESYIGKNISVYAAKVSEKKFTLYGDEEFYIAVNSDAVDAENKGLSYEGLMEIHNVRFPEDVCDMDNLASVSADEKFKTYMMDGNQRLYIAMCNIHAYQSSYVMYTEKVNQEGVSSLVLNQYKDGEIIDGDRWIIDPEYDQKSKTLTTRSKGRAMGDCGSKAFYHWEGQDGGFFDLVKYWSKDECDGDFEASWPLQYEKK